MKRRPFAAVAAVLGLVAGAAAVALPAAAAPPAGAAYVAVGDSFAAGTGVPPYDDLTLHSTTSAYPELLSHWGRLKNFSDVTAAGATTDAISAQLDAANVGPFTKTVTVTVGGNDVGWTEALGTCLLNPAACNTAIAGVVGGVTALPGGIADVVREVADAAPNARIKVTGYPYLFGDFTDPCVVGYAPTLGEPVPVSISAASAAAINGVTFSLNTAIAAGVAASGESMAAYVDIVSGSLTHGVCGSGEDWINGLSFDTSTGLPAPTSFHPNAAGEQAYADAITLAIKAD